MKRKTFRRILLGFAILILLLITVLARPVWHLTRTAWDDRNDIFVQHEGTIDDASRLDETPVAEIWKIPAEYQDAEFQLSELLQRARSRHLKVSIAGARHSMGGHIIARNGIVIDMLRFNRMEIDESKRILRVGAGALWSDVIRFLNQRGLSVEIMQSNDNFSVGGSLSVNCHGWQFNRPPIASSVESFRLMQSDGKIVRCSRQENRELFSLVLGGYGLFGIILDADLRVVPNEKYKIERVIVAVGKYAETFAEKTLDAADVGMTYGRLDVSSGNFLKEGMISVFRRSPATNSLITTLIDKKDTRLQRAIFRGGVDDDYGKRLRWNAEKYFSSAFSGDVFDRNAILYESSAWFENRNKDATDILMEYFVPPKNFELFVKELQKIIPENHADLLNVTLRDVRPDHDSFLNYADKEMVALVMFFNQKRDADSEEAAKKLTREMITAVLKYDGKYYLPYRLHATREQFYQAYPQAKQFFEMKRKYDPEELFENEFYRTYGK